MLNFKGLLRMSLKTGDQNFSGRAAWATAMPDRMRVELLNMLGQPMTSLAGDGQHLTLISHTDQRFYRMRQTRTALENLVHIPIGVQELNQLLAGRPPLPDFEAVQLSSRQKANGTLLDLKNRWHSTLAQLHLDDSNQLSALKVFKPDGNLLYQIRWLQWQVVSGSSVPRRLQLDAPDGQHLEILIERFWANVDLPPDVFKLSDPKA
jgi:outer membrane biogenesis lipoprotein LolB